ncbi:hypothetical protein N656DRAFT_834011 [Canariomyces notabilis]|uniref:Uncharacterized protein n=1 Tax=Canariomyces notabilis TaxID=2074819 RepID=A0AAN6TPS0_9PEZI|nr:hypothetical protein N656DRAFT_834011 [Canariomyces arenarius]
MVSLEQIRHSNSQISTALPPGLVAVFAGATNGIGESSLRQFVKHAVRPRIYFLGRSKMSGDRVCADLQKLNPEGEYTFTSVDISLLISVDEFCREIKAKESAINLLFLSTGTMITGKDTAEGLHHPLAVAYYARLRFIVNLLPLLQNATGLRRVVTVLAGTKEGPIYTDDFQCRQHRILSPGGRGHLSSMTTLALEAVARNAPGVSFIHSFPGFVRTNLGNDLEGLGAMVMRGVFNVVVAVVGPFVATPLEEAGERHVFLATSAMFSSRGSTSGVPLPEGLKVGRGTDGMRSSGVYSTSKEAESASRKTERLLEGMRKDGTAESVWSHVEEEFVRITGVASI